MINSYSNLSIQVSKQLLNEIVANVFELKFQIFWGFERGTMVLHIYNAHATNKLIFVRHKGFLELISVNLACDEITNILDKELQLTSQAEIKMKATEELSASERNEKIDFYLGELFGFMKKEDKVNIEKIKGKLTKLVNE